MEINFKDKFYSKLKDFNESELYLYRNNDIHKEFYRFYVHDFNNKVETIINWLLDKRLKNIDFSNYQEINDVCNITVIPSNASIISDYNKILIDDIEHRTDNVENVNTDLLSFNGYLIILKKDNKPIYILREVNPVITFKKKNNFVFVNHGNELKTIEKSIIRLSFDFDVIIIDDHVFLLNDRAFKLFDIPTKLEQNKDKIIEIIDRNKIVTDIETLNRVASKNKVCKALQYLDLKIINMHKDNDPNFIKDATDYGVLFDENNKARTDTVTMAETYLDYICLKYNFNRLLNKKIKGDNISIVE